ncbi:hypothetical protein SynSYN20_00859 [Synechococcus sp. SYN20]|nr:hypothetical protein SynMVIR181_00778 [Synechococcus sp. MVIR-18-1]QNJ25200.1 hypothetical protein SynSYN20_00859 [Synechococcus sp. SYN20]
MSLESQTTEPQQGQSKRVKGSVTATAQEQLLISTRWRTGVGSANNSIC